MRIKYKNEKCKYPNLALEILLHNAGHPDTYASHANVTSELLAAVMEGTEDLTIDEMLKIKGLYSLFGGSLRASFGYLISPVLSFYDMQKPKHCHKVMFLYSQLEKAKQSPFYKESRLYKTLTLEEIKQSGFITYAEINTIKKYIWEVELS